MPDPQIYCFPAKRMGFPVVQERGISFLRDLEEQDTDGKLSAVTLQEHSCSCCSSFFLELIVWLNTKSKWFLGSVSQLLQLVPVKGCSPSVPEDDTVKDLGISACAAWDGGSAKPGEYPCLDFSCSAVHPLPPFPSAPHGPSNPVDPVLGPG